MKRFLAAAMATGAVLSGFAGEMPVACAEYGGNSIRLYVEPLAYEVASAGEILVRRTPIALAVDGRELAGVSPRVVRETLSGTEATPIYKKAEVNLAANSTFADFGEWGVRLIARADGVAYRFETKFAAEITITGERAGVNVPTAATKCFYHTTNGVGQEEAPPEIRTAGEICTGFDQGPKNWWGNGMVYLPMVFEAAGKHVAVVESDVWNYPIWNLTHDCKAAGTGDFASYFEPWPKRTERVCGWDGEKCAQGGRWVKIAESETFLVKTAGTRTYPWRAFIIAEAPVKFCEADMVRALAAVTGPGMDFSWVKPGKVAWDWWNCFDNQGDAGCNTKTYERFIDFAASNGVEYVIFDEGWSEKLDIWKFAPAVDVPHLIEYADQRGVGIILWMAWAQVYGEEAKVAEHFAKLGAKGFKVDFMDRGDAEVAQFLEKFALECAKRRMLVDYHGSYRPVGMQRRFPNIINYEGIHGLEHMKWFKETSFPDTERGALANEVAAFFLRLTAGPMDFTPGAMENWAVGAGYKVSTNNVPGAIGSRSRQMAMIALYEAPLQMLCDSPTQYEKNLECFRFMAATPTVWADTVGLDGSIETFAMAARKAPNGDWYAAAINNHEARTVKLTTDYLARGTWKAEIFRDSPETAREGRLYVHETREIKAGDTLELAMVPGGGFVVRFSK